MYRFAASLASKTRFARSSTQQVIPIGSRLSWSRRYAATEMGFGVGSSVAARSLRDAPPAHYNMKVEKFSLLSKMMQDSKEQKYESDTFEAGGYNWRLSLYPNGDQERNGKGYISLYLKIADTTNLPLGWEVNVNAKLFLLDQIQDKYVVVQDANGKVTRFHAMKTEWGFLKFLPLSTFTDAANGFLIRDTCVFGAEVFVANYTGRGECLNIMEDIYNVKPRIWKIENFSSLHDKTYYSDVFTFGNRKWKIQLYPKGVPRQKGKFLSLFFKLCDSEDFPSGQNTYAKFKLRVLNQDCNHVERAATHCFSAPPFSWGWSTFLSLTDLEDATKGFLVNDTLLIEVEVSAVTVVKKLSKSSAPVSSTSSSSPGFLSFSCFVSFWLIPILLALIHVFTFL